MALTLKEKIKRHRARQKLRESTPEIDFLNKVIDFVAYRRDIRKSDGVLGRLAIIAAEQLAKSEIVPSEESGWQKFALDYNIFGAIQRTQSTLVREMAIEAMTQAGEVIDAEMSPEEGERSKQATAADVRAGLAAAALLVKDRPKLDMEEIQEWLVDDLTDVDHYGQAPDWMRVDEGYVLAPVDIADEDDDA